jgi:hypothetical protein
MGLKPGHVNDFANSMAQAIEQAFADEWQAVKGTPLPEGDPTDRRLLFVAIARGVLGYLEANQDQTIANIRLDDGDGFSQTWNVTALDLNIEL